MISFLRILLVEHDQDMASITKNYLVSRGYSTIMCLNGEEALHHFKKQQFDFVIADVNIPIVSGYDLVAQIRSKDMHIPIILLGANPHQTDIIRGFDAGADDFIARPFSMEELGVRINAIQKRVKTNTQRQHIFTVGGYTLDTLHHVLIYDGREKRLTTKELDLLYLFCEYSNRVVERSLALKRVWNSENYFNARNMDVYIGRLRNMLCHDPNVQLENVHGIGYKLVVQST